MNHKKFRTLSIDQKTSDILNYLVDLTGKQKSDLIAEVFEQLVGVAVSMRKPTILRFESSIITKSVTISFEGLEKLVHGQFSAQSTETTESCDKKVRKKLVKK